MKYEVHGQEEGRGPVFKKKFATLREVQEYVKARWEGPDYIDGPAEFHSDYCTYDLVGCELADLGNRRVDDFYSWDWKVL
jgi:hypothetical protein